MTWDTNVRSVVMFASSGSIQDWVLQVDVAPSRDDGKVVVAMVVDQVTHTLKYFIFRPDLRS